MRTTFVPVLPVALAMVLHIDWHLARPLHHRLSLALPYHWAITALAFAVAGWWIGNQFRTDRWRVAAIIFAGAVLLAQGVEPVLEVLVYDGRFGYPADPGRWPAFFRTIAAATPAYFATVWLCGRAPERAVTFGS
jgi:hypothetical protein